MRFRSGGRANLGSKTMSLTASGESDAEPCKLQRSREARRTGVPWGSSSSSGTAGTRGAIGLVGFVSNGFLALETKSQTSPCCKPQRIAADILGVGVVVVVIVVVVVVLIEHVSRARIPFGFHAGGVGGRVR